MHYLDDAQKKKNYNKELFTIVAPRYDTVTRVLSFFQDARWKKTLITLLPDLAAPTCLDIACGTGDLTRAVAAKYPHGTVVGLDLTPAMINQAKKLAPDLTFNCGDMCALPFENSSYDIVTGGYALRNAPDLALALSEIARVLKPGGIAVFLEFSKSPYRAIAWVQYLLLNTWGSLWGLIFHGKPDVYAYIAQTVKRHPDHQKLAHVCTQAGLNVTSMTPRLCSMVHLVVLKKML